MNLNFMQSRKVLLILLPLLALVLVAVIGLLYLPNVQANKYELKIARGTSYAQLYEQLLRDGVLKQPKTFDFMAGVMGYKKDEIPSGRFVLKSGMTNRALLSKLRSGNQDAIQLTFNNARDISQLAGMLSHDLEADSLSLLTAFLADSLLQKNGLKPETAMTRFIPNTYEVFWNITPEKLVKRMQVEADQFWNEERKAKAAAIPLSKEEVYTLASIVEKESNNKKERPTVAGVYLNRLKVGEKLRADPTVVFAVGDFSIRRVLFEHVFFDSPYNTYLYEGLPPGPIYMPSTNAIDAVLNAEKHDYLFFCAKPGYNSEHAFAVTAEQHQRNASIYHNWLEKEGIR